MEEELNHEHKHKRSTASRQCASLGYGEVIIGYIQGVLEHQRPEVSFHLNGETHVQVAFSTVPISMDNLGRNVVLSFVEGDLTRPIVMGLLWQSTQTASMNDNTIPNKNGAHAVEAKLDAIETQSSLGEDIRVVHAHDRLELKCGAASITLTRTGKILLRGEYISSRSKGAQRIKGGSVQIN